MVVMLARIYVYLLSTLICLLLALLLAIHISLICGNAFPMNGPLCALFFAVNVPTIGLAEDRNIWAHELKRCPLWLRIALPLLFVYSIAMMLLGVAFVPPIAPSSWDCATSGFMFMFSVASGCVLYATIRAAESNQPDLLARVKRSLFATVVAGTFVLFAFLTPHKTITR